MGNLEIVAAAHAAGKTYGRGPQAVRALHNVSLSLARGECVAVMGRSGCGKTTLLNLLGALDTPTSGRIELAGADTTALDDRALTRLRHRTIGFVFQAFHLLPTLSLRENVELPLLLDPAERIPPRPERARRVAQLLEQVGLGHRAAAFPYQVSGGEMQRAAIARALVHKPLLVIADEPTGNLDEQNAASVLDLLTAVAHERKAAVLLATHSQEAAARAQRIYYLRDGEIESVKELSL